MQLDARTDEEAEGNAVILDAFFCCQTGCRRRRRCCRCRRRNHCNCARARAVQMKGIGKSRAIARALASTASRTRAHNYTIITLITRLTAMLYVCMCAHDVVHAWPRVCDCVCVCVLEIRPIRQCRLLKDFTSFYAMALLRHWIAVRLSRDTRHKASRVQVLGQRTHSHAHVCVSVCACECLCLFCEFVSMR